MGRLGDPGAPGVSGPPRAAGALEVRGGLGGTRATLESIVAAASHADRAARSLASAAVCVRRAAAYRWPPAAHDAGYAAEGALARIDRGGTSIAACADRAAAMAVALRTAVRTYEDADHDARTRLTAATVLVCGTIGDLGPIGWVLVGGGAVALTVVGRDVLALRTLRATPGLAGLGLRTLPDLSGLPGLAGLLGGAVTADGGLLPDGTGLPHGDTVEVAVAGLAAFALGTMPGRWTPTARPVERLTGVIGVVTDGFGRFAGAPRREVVVAPLVGGLDGAGRGRASGGGSRGGKQAPERPPEGVGDVVAQVAALGDQPQPTIAVQRLDHADGKRTWVVSVPGTRSTDLLGGANPMDNTTNLALMAGRPDDMTEAVEVAMLQAGVGPDEPVLLAGHSQGGMVATRLASSLQGTFDVAAVVTAGSPVGWMPVPDDVAALHLEHAEDYVPALDGWRNPDAPNRTTVVRDLPGAPATTAGTRPGLVPADLIPAHEAWRYAETAAMVDGLRDPSVRGFQEALDGVLGDGTARVTTQAYAVARVPVPEPHPARLRSGGG